MKHANNKLLLVAAAIAVATATQASEYESVLSAPTVRATLTDTAGIAGSFAEEGIATEEKKSVGVESTQADNTAVYAIPLSYGLPMNLLGGEEFLNLSAYLAYATSDLSDENGVGDSSVGAEYYFESNDLIVKTAVDIKLSTGDEDKGLGTGSTDLGFSAAVRKRMGEIGYKGSVGYTFTGERDFGGGAKFEYGNIFVLGGGAEFKLMPQLWAGADLAFVNTATGTNKFTGFADADSPGLQTLDIIPNAAYRVMEGKDVTFSLVVPVYEDWVDGPSGVDPADRDVSFKVGFNSEF